MVKLGKIKKNMFKNQMFFNDFYFLTEIAQNPVIQSYVKIQKVKTFRSSMKQQNVSLKLFKKNWRGKYGPINKT